MKQLKLILLLCICCQRLYAQNPLDLRGVRYYYSTPTLGNFGSCNYYSPLSIVEKGNIYMIGGAQFDGYARAGMVCINKWNSNIWWDYRTPLLSWSGIGGINVLPNNHFLSIQTTEFPNQDTLRTVIFNQLGFLSEKKAPAKRILNLDNLTKLSSTISAVSSWSHEYLDTMFPTVDLIDENGNYLYTKELPIVNTFNNLPVDFAFANASFPYYDAVVTIGHQLRPVSETRLNEIMTSPVLWVWGSDYIFFSREIYKDYAPHNASHMFDYIDHVDAYDNEYAFTSRANLPDGSGGSYLTYLDTNLQVKCFKEIRSNNSPNLFWTVSDVKIDTATNQILVTGEMITYSNAQFEFIQSSVNYVARFYSNGNPIYYKYFYYDHNEKSCNDISMTICENGDLLFSGFQQNVSEPYFFTYRTDQDGYHPDGQYLGFHEVTVSPSEIGIFPNPSEGIFQVSSMFEEAMQVIILDQQEKKVAQFELNELSSNSSFDLSDQAPGVYFAHISQGEQQWVKKLVVR